MSKSSKTTGTVLILLSLIGLSIGGFFFYKFYKDGAPEINKPENIEKPMDLDIPNYKAMEPYSVLDANPNPDPSTYEIVNHEDLRFTYETISENSRLEGMLPSVGNPNVLLVPVQFDDLARRDNMIWDENKLLRLNGVFNGTKEDCTNEYNESVRSFYRKSSYGLLDINFVLTDPFTPSISSDTFVSKEGISDGGGTSMILNEFYKKGKINGKNINFQNPMFDINDDDYIDGVWLIYNEERTSKSQYFDRYWPYVYWYIPNEPPRYGQQVFSAYANCSVNFTYQDSFQGLDAHTLIHETGHLMGLDDYYSYDLHGQVAAIGGLDMMDFNIGEHNSFSKTALGWTNPIIPKKSGTFTLRPFEETGDCLILANDFNDSAFSEYIILEYYTPTGLNEFDAKKAYPGRSEYFSQSGIRAFHVDARLVEILGNVRTGETKPTGYLDSSVTKLKQYTADGSSVYFYVPGHSNTRSRNGSYVPTPKAKSEDLIAVISSDGKAVYGSRTPVTNKSLFRNGDSLSWSGHQKYFPSSKINQLKFNDGSNIKFDFSVGTIGSEGIEVQISL